MMSTPQLPISKFLIVICWTVFLESHFLAPPIYAQGTVNIVKLEYFFDTDPGYEMGIDVPITSGPDLSLEFVANLDGLDDGFHVLFVRGQDENGDWSLTHTHSFFKESINLAQPSNITKFEYFLDIDPGFDNGIDVPVQPPEPNLTRELVVDLGQVSDGFHVLYVRGQDIEGNWSLVHTHSFFKESINLAQPSNITKLEYFLDIDPGFDNGIDIPVQPPEPNLTRELVVDLGQVSDGFHVLYVRGQDTEGNWSLVHTHSFFKEAGSINPLPNIKAIEYFVTKEGAEVLPKEAILLENPSPDIRRHLVVDFPNLAEDLGYFLHVRGIDEHDRPSLDLVHDFDIQPLVPGTVQQIQKISEQEGGFGGSVGDNAGFGSQIASLGDLDGDGIPDIAVAAAGDTNSGGSFWILFMNPDCTVKAEQEIASGKGGFSEELNNGDFFGASICALGDLNGDGIGDLAVGAPGDDDGGMDQGAVWILFMDPDHAVASQKKISEGAVGFSDELEAGDFFGFSVTMIGDIDRDGTNDIAVGAPFDDDGGMDSESNRGAVWLLCLNSDGTVKAHHKISAMNENFSGNLDDGDQFGQSLSSLGDLDQDGYADLAVGAPLDDDGGNDKGAVWILFLDPSDTVDSHTKISDSSGDFGNPLQDLDEFGASVSHIKDLDGDGISDIAVVAPGDVANGLRKGATWIVFLNRDGSVKGSHKISLSAESFDVEAETVNQFSSVAFIGDLNGDRVMDLAISNGLEDIFVAGDDHGAFWVVTLAGSPLASVGDLVWNDRSNNGIQNDGEPGIGGVEVKLFQVGKDNQVDSSDDFLIGKQRSGDRGEYEFHHINSGNYYLTFESQGNFNFTKSQQGNNDDVDSDVDPSSGTTESILLKVGEKNTSTDAGIAENQLPIITILSPSINENFTLPLPMMVSANVLDPDGTIQHVKFFREAECKTEGVLEVDCNRVFLGTVDAVDSSDNYSLEIDTKGIIPGAYILFAVATDDDGGESTSNPIPFTVNNPFIEFTRPTAGEEPISNTDSYTFTWTMPLDRQQDSQSFNFDLYLLTENTLSLQQFLEKISGQEAFQVNSTPLNSLSTSNGSGFTFFPDPEMDHHFPATPEGLVQFPYIHVPGDNGEPDHVFPSPNSITVVQTDERERVNIQLTQPTDDSEIVFGSSVIVEANLSGASGGTFGGENTITLDFFSPGEPDVPATTEIATLVNGLLRFRGNQFFPDNAGDWSVRLNWPGNAVFQPEESPKQEFTVIPSNAILRLSNLGAPHRPDEDLKISGLISLVNGNSGMQSLENIPISFVVRDLNHKEVDNALAAVTQKDGRFTITIAADSIFDRNGDWAIQAQSGQTINVNAAESKEHRIPVRGRRGYAILVQGSVPGNEGLDEHKNTLDFVKNVLTLSGQITDDDMIPEVDDIIELFVDSQGTTSSGIGMEMALRAAIEVWAKNRLLLNPAPLYIVFVNHGNFDRFHLNPDILKPKELDRMLLTLESSFPDGSLVAKEKIILVFGMCFSGSFMDTLSRPGRIVISTAARNERSIRGPSIFDSVNENETTRQGEFFVYLLFHGLSRGNSLLDSFRRGNRLIKQMSAKFDLVDATLAIEPETIGLLGQHPLLDDDANGLGSNQIILDSADGRLAADVFLKSPDRLTQTASSLMKDPSRIPGIAEVNPILFLKPGEDAAGRIWAEINQTPTQDTPFPVCLEVKPPGDLEVDTKIVNPNPSMQADLSLDFQSMEIDSGIGSTNRRKVRYVWPNTKDDDRDLSLFDAPGVYEIFFNAVLNMDQLRQPSEPVMTFLYRASDNQSLGTVILDGPTDNRVIDFIDGTGKFTWNEVGMIDGAAVRYIFRLWFDKSTKDLVFESEPLADNEFHILPQELPLVDGKLLEWDVVAVDTQGRASESVNNEIRNVTFILTNHIICIGKVSVTIKDSEDGSMINGAMVKFSPTDNTPGPTVSSVEGGIAFVTMGLEEGDYDVTVTKKDYLASDPIRIRIIECDSDLPEILRPPPILLVRSEKKLTLTTSSPGDIQFQEMDVSPCSPGDIQNEMCPCFRLEDIVRDDNQLFCITSEGRSTYEQQFPGGSTVNLNAPLSILANQKNFIFSRWKINDIEQPEGEQQISVVLDRNGTVEAIYEEGDFVLSVISLPENEIHLSIADTNFSDDTSYTKAVDDAEYVRLSASTSSGDRGFIGWFVNGQAMSNEETLELPAISENTFVIALYESEILFENGWNLIATPVEPNDDFVAALKVLQNPLWKWENGRYIPIPINSLHPGTAYWINSAHVRTISALGSVPLDLSISLHPGWNAIGVKDHQILDKNEVSTLTNDTTIWTWDCATSRFLTIDDASLPNFQRNKLFPGIGYWVYKK